MTKTRVVTANDLSQERSILYLIPISVDVFAPCARSLDVASFVEFDDGILICVRLGIQIDTGRTTVVII